MLAKTETVFESILKNEKIELTAQLNEALQEQVSGFFYLFVNYSQEALRNCQNLATQKKFMILFEVLSKIH